MKELSCGLLINTPQGLLLVHASRTTRWDLPKGRIEPGETPRDGAFRETYEETGLDLAHLKDQAEDLGMHAYLPRKDLHLFRVTMECVDLTQCTCHTTTTTSMGTYPETDKWAYVPYEQAHLYLGKSMTQTLQRIGVLPVALSAPPANTTSVGQSF